MLIDKLKYLQGYVKIRLYGYAPERFFNLCSNHDILIWNLEYRDERYEFCISVKGLKNLRPILKKTRTKFEILERHGMPFFLHKYRKRKLFAAGVFLCCGLLYAMSLFIWKIEVEGNQHRTDSSITKFLEENHVYHGMLKSKINCEEIEELLRTGYDDIIWASAKIEGTMLVIEIQENLAANQQAEEKVQEDGRPTDIVADKDAQIYSILTRKGVPKVEKGMEVHTGDLLVEGKIPVMDDNGEVSSFQYTPSDADIMGITEYSYEDSFSMTYRDKVFTGRESKGFCLRIGKNQIKFPVFGENFKRFDTITDEYDMKAGETFYLPLVWIKETHKEYQLMEKHYSKEEAKKRAEWKLKEFSEKLTQKGVQIIENSVIIVTDKKYCRASGTLKVIEQIGKSQATVIEEPQEGQIKDESDGNSD